MRLKCYYGKPCKKDGTTYQDQGIKLENDCDWNRITNNTAIDNQAYGIYFVNECDENTIANNTVNNLLNLNKLYHSK